jgi:hypothetical protein
MNAKLKNILTTAWNEPRAFFLWLMLLCALIFGGLTVFIQATEPGRNYLNPILPAPQMAALFALVGFGISFLCFSLAWIPPLRRLFAWLLRRRFFVLAALATLIALAYAVENWRGRHAWTQFQREWEAKGERFNLADVIPAPVPDDENFFMTKPWKRFHFTQTNDTIHWEDEDSHEQPVLDAFGPKAGQVPNLGSQAKGTRTDLKDWQDFYRGTNNMFTNATGTVTNYFPTADHPQTPAQDVLLALSKYQDTLQQLHEAARRPRARFWINYEDSYGAWLPHLSRLKGCAQYLNLHALASLANDDSTTAFQDLQLSFRLGETIKSEPVLISYLVQIAMSNLRISTLWEGLADHRWSDTQLAAFGEALARENHLENYQLGMRGERAFCNATFDQLRRTRDWNWISDSESPAQTQTLLDTTLGNSLFRLVPAGWFDQNKVSMSRVHVEFILPAVDITNQIVSPTTTKRMDQESISRATALSPYNMFSHMLFPALSGTAEKAARAQSLNDRARIAIAMERHRLAHGQFPENLATLAPKFIAKLPHDVINGQPLKYRRTDEGSFILYSVGWNETDDGGAVAFSKDGKNVDWKEGDWVWRYPAK